MPEITITVGGRAFPVTCQPGEENFLRGAAQMLDAEAQPLVAQMGRLPEARMLLMAGLMLADKTAANEDENKSLRARVLELEARVQALGSGGGGVPREVTEMLAELAARAEALAAQVEDRR
jgi:cell division protein ZapA